MKGYFCVLLPILLFACGTKSFNKSNIDGEKTDHPTIALDTISEGMNDDEMAVYYVIVADTSNEYSQLHKKMLELNRKFNIPIDTMGRFYNVTKNLIALPDNDEDEIYAGDYFPRRFPSENLSLEYLNFYQRNAGEKTIALVTGIYELEKSADSALTVLQQTEKKVFKIKSDIYVGCMH